MIFLLQIIFDTCIVLKHENGHITECKKHCMGLCATKRDQGI